MTTLAGTAYRRTVGVVGEPTVGRATALVAVVMCLAAVSEPCYGASNGGLGEVPTVAALFVLPLLYVFPATRPRWLRHRYLLLAAQAALTYLPFIWFGADWARPGWLAGLVLLTVPWPASWFVAALLAAIEAAIWAGAVGELSNQPTMPAAVSAMFVFVFDAVVLFGLARLTDLIKAVHAATDELAEAAVTEERVRAADSLRAAVGGGAAGDRCEPVGGPPAHRGDGGHRPRGTRRGAGGGHPVPGRAMAGGRPRRSGGTAGDSSHRPSAGA